MAGTCAQGCARKIMPQNARSGQEPAPRIMPIADLQRIAQARPKSRRRLGAFSDVPLGTAVRITARSFAGMRRVTTGPTTACGTCVALNALLQDRRPLGWFATAVRERRSLLKHDRSVSVGADVVGNLEGTADATAHSVQEWSALAAAGWATKSIGAMGLRVVVELRAQRAHVHAVDQVLSMRHRLHAYRVPDVWQ